LLALGVGVIPLDQSALEFAEMLANQIRRHRAQLFDVIVSS